METTPNELRSGLWWTCLAIIPLLFSPSSLISQCDTEVSGIYTYCNAVGTPGTTGYFVAFRVYDPTGDTLNVVDIDGNNVTNRGKRIDDINTQLEPATVTVIPLRISGVGADTLEFWYFGPYANGSTFNIALVDPNNVCDTIFVASGTYTCADNSGISDPMACDNDVPLYFLDFSQTEFIYGGGGGGNENFDEVFVIMQRSRESFCCDLQPANQSCFEFVIRLSDQDVGLTIDDVGSGSPGGEIYADTLNMFVCTGDPATTWPFTQSGGQSQDLPLCLPGGDSQEYLVLSCKSGGNATGVSIDALSSIFAPPQSTIEPCNVTLEVFGADTVTYSSPDDPNLDNLISCTGDSTICTFFYDTLTFGEVTSCEGDTFTYIVGSTPGSNQCLALDTILYDTTYVVVYPTFTVNIDTACNSTGDSLVMTAVVSSAAAGCDYSFNWSTGDTTQTITVAFSNTEYFVTVTRSDLPIDIQSCALAVDSIVAEGGLMISCANISDTLYACINQLPDPDTTLVIISGCTTNPLIYTVDISNGATGCIGDTLIITRHYIVDFDGDTITTTTDRDTCTQLLSFVDDVPPVITSGCPANVTVSCASQVPAADPGALTATDNCDANVEITHSGDVITNQTCTNRFTITRTYQATDDCGNSSTCAQTITVFDATPPFIICPANVTVQCASQVPAASTTALISSDNCGGSVSLIHEGDAITNMTCLNRFTITRTYRATDECGNTATCIQNITVFDDTPPSIACPVNVTVQCANQVPAPNTAAVLSTDNCGGAVTITHTGDVITNMTCTNRFTINRTYRATDECGNSATCAQVITVFDNTLPIITCPADVTIECNESSSPANTGTATATDNCGGTPAVDFADTSISGLCPTSVSRTWTAIDECGNSAQCVQLITIDDTTPPALTCPADTIIDCTESTLPANTGTATATDNCTVIPLVVPVDMTVAGSCPQEYTINRTWTATDSCQNTSSCLQTITVQDTTPPTFNPACQLVFDFYTSGGSDCPAQSSMSISEGDIVGESEGWTVGGNPIPSLNECLFDNCSNPDSLKARVDSISITGDSCDRTFTVFFTILDQCGNESASQFVCVVHIHDDVPPVITCPGDVTIDCEDSTSPDNTGVATATDDCQLDVAITYTDSIMPGTCPQELTIFRTWTADDSCGNTDACLQIITVQDTTSPAIVCPPDITINNTEDTSPFNTGTASATDNCAQIIVLSYNDVIIEGDCDGDYLIQRTFTATDDCSNTSTCLQTIDVAGACNLDLSLVKELSAGQGPVEGGDNVNFTITVTNEGTLVVGSISIIDYIPDGFVLNDADWTAGTAGSTGQSASIVLSTANGGLDPGGLMAAESVSIEITLQAEPDIAPGIYTNIAEITAVLDTNGVDVSNADVDSNPDTNDTNDPPAEDDHDPALICVISEPIIVGDQFVCTGDTATYSVSNFDPSHTYMWALSGGGVIIENNDSSIVIQWTVTSGGPFVITVNEISAPDCQSTGSLEVFIQGGDPIACLDLVNLSIDNECGTVVTSGLILTGESAGDNNYIVYVIDMNGDTIPNATLTFMHVGQTFTVSVVNECSGQSCWGFIFVEDKMPPVINCVCPIGNEGNSCIISCLEIDTFLYGEIPLEVRPTVVDNCGGSTLEIIDRAFNFETCSGGYIRITWLATDGSGNTSTCIQEFIIEPLTLETLVFPPAFTGECTESSDPSVTGWPTVNGMDLTNIPGFCNIIATYSDLEIPLCGGGRKIIRTWTVFDWCVPEVVEFVQVIILMDRTGPVLTCPPDMTVGTDVWFCTANVVIPRPVAVDACSDVTRFQLFYEEGVVVPAGNVFRIPNLSLGVHTLRWIVTDECLNTSSCTFDITVVDNVPPVMSCQQHLVISLTNDRPNGITLIPAEVFNDLSQDNCSPVQFRVRRMDSCIDFNWTTNGACVDDIPGGIPAVNSRDRGTSLGICVPFSCCDIGSGPIMVELEGRDAAGNLNYCMVEVVVQDKLAPSVTCPPDISVSCEFDFDVSEGLFSDVNGNNDGSLDEDPLSEIFGNMLDAFRHDESDRGDIIINDPTNTTIAQPFNWGIDGFASDNCEVNLSVVVSVFEDCSGAGLPGDPPPGATKLITRRFIAFDASGNPSPGSCVQRIWVIDFNPFYISDTTCGNADIFDGVIWPCDVLLSSCPEELSGTGEPLIIDDHCSLIGVAFDDTRFDFADGTCYKVLREWSIIDWCQFDANTGAGIWSYTQTIKVMDSAGPLFLNCPQAPVELCLNDPGVTLPANNQSFIGENNPNASSCSVHVALTQRVRELCSASVTYDVKLYPFNGSDFIQLKPTTTLVLNANHEGDLSFNTQESTIQSISEDGLPYNNPLCGDYHRLVWTVEDGCGNLSICDYLLRLEDCKDPSPVCINGLSSVIMPESGEVTIWAVDFNASSFDDCTPAAELLFSFSGTTYQPSFTYTCDNVPEFGVPIEVEIWAADGGADQNCNGLIEWSERNKDFCITFIIITDNNNVCEEGGTVLVGEIMTEHTDAVSNVLVNLISPEGPLPGFVTSTDGKFIFDNVQQGIDYTIKAERNDNHRNGVSTLDLVRIQKHLLGKELFTSSYQYVAADANSSGSVSAVDLVEIRKLILGLYSEFPSNQSWRFVKKGSEMAVGHPWPLEEEIEIENLSEGQVNDLDFVGVKIGDVNNTVKANALQIQPRTVPRIMNINAISRGDLKSGDVIEVKLVFPEITSGFQWTMEAKGLEFATVKSNNIQIDESHVGVHENSIITMSWNGDPVNESNSKPELSLIIEFKVTAPGLLKEMLRISSLITAAEAYTLSGEILGVQLVFDDPGFFTEFALYQNQPNPWNGQTLIGFDLPNDAPAILTVYDVAGKVVKTISGNYKEGYNTIILTTRELPDPGILYYRLESGGYSATKKMMNIR